MKRRKAAAVCLAILLFTVLGMPASAKTWSGDDFTMEVPEEFVYTLNQNSSIDDPVWALVGEGDPSARLTDFAEMNVLESFYTEDGSTNIIVMTKESTDSKNIFDLKNLGQEERDEFLDKLAQTGSDEVSLVKTYEDIDGRPFYRMQIDSAIAGAEAHDVVCGTIFNGKALTIEMYNGEREITQEQAALFNSLVGSVRVTQVLEKPEPQASDYLPAILVLVLLALAVITPVIYFPLKGRYEKKKKNQMGERLSRFHQDHPDNVVSGELRFLNLTDCTREAIHTFSLYQAYVKNVVSLAVGVLVCVLTLLGAFLLDVTWWLKVASVAVSVYYAYKLISMPGAIEKVQLKVFQRGVSSTARYSFYEDAFLVSGIQSGNLYPYFQITSIRRHGHYLYLYYGPENAYLIDQFGFEKGEFEDFVKFIEEKTKGGK